MSKLSNDQNLKNYQTRKILRYLIMIFSLMTIALAFTSLVIEDRYSMVFTGLAVLSFLIEAILLRMRNNIQIELSEENKKEKGKKKKKRVSK